jgi:nitronate monooxygenase
LFEGRKKVCNLGYLRNLYKKQDGSVGYRCPAESKAAYEKKGGVFCKTTEGKRCLCNALFATVGLPTIYNDGTIEKALITIGSKVDSIKDLIKRKANFSAGDVVDFILNSGKSESTAK